MRSTLLAAVLLAAAGCSSGDADEPTCESPQGALPQNGIALGVSDAGSFRELEDQGTLELVLGNQGGWMVLPVMRLEMGDVDVRCLGVGVGLELQILDSDLAAALPVAPVAFTEVDGGWYSDPLFLFLSLDVEELEGRRAALAARVAVGEDESVVEVDSLTLVNAE